MRFLLLFLACFKYNGASYTSIRGARYLPTANGDTEFVITKWTPLLRVFACSPIKIWGSFGKQRPNKKW